MYLKKSFAYDCSYGCNSSHDLGSSGFTCLGRIINPQIFSRSISGFECIPCTKISGFNGTGVTVGISF